MSKNAFSALSESSGLTRREFLLHSASGLALIALNSCTSAKFALFPQRWSGLKKALAGTDAVMLTPSDASFLQMKEIINLRIKNEPQLIVRCASAESVSRLVSWANENKTPLRLRSGGHSYEGYCTGPSIVLDCRPMNSLVLKQNEKTLRAGAGVTTGAIIEAANKVNLGLPTGTCLGVGISGLTLGGGVGVVARKYGLTCDSLRQATVVLASGKIIQTSLSENSDLFWALKGGGGGNFAAVTDFDFNLYPLSDVYNFNMSWDFSHAAEVCQKWQEIFPNAPREYMGFLSFVKTPEDISVGVVGNVVGRKPGEVPNIERVKKLLAPLVALKPKTFEITKRSSLESAKKFFGEESSPFKFKSKSHYAMKDMTKDSWDDLIQIFEATPKEIFAVIMFNSFGGKIKEGDSAFAHRDARFSLQYHARWKNDDQEETHLSNLRRIHERAQHYLGNNAYINYCDLDIAEWCEAYYGKNLEKLLNIKRKYDPSNVFDYGQQSLSRLL
jgi:hypothetical protein